MAAAPRLERERKKKEEGESLRDIGSIVLVKKKRRKKGPTRLEKERCDQQIAGVRGGKREKSRVGVLIFGGREGEKKKERA